MKTLTWPMAAKKKKINKKQITIIKEYENTYMAEGCQIQLK